jgi:hypothetical protein
MSAPYARWDFRCNQCGAMQSFTLAELTDQLRSLKFLRRSDQPDEATILELTRSSMASGVWPACETCGKKQFSPPTLESTDFTTEWNDEIPCESCGQIIPQERLELFPDSRSCVRCQQKTEKSGSNLDIEYCRHCGNILQIRLSSRRATSYRRYCPACKKEF